MRRGLSIVARLALVGLGAVAAGGCEGATTSTDSRFATPERTVATLLASHGLEGVSQDEIRERMARHERFAVTDEASFRACFVDLDDPLAEGLAGWVLGALAAGRDELRTEIFAESATVAPREGVRIAMQRRPDGTWRIALRDSVPADVRRALASVAQRHDRRARAQGLPLE